MLNDDARRIARKLRFQLPAKLDTEDPGHFLQLTAISLAGKVCVQLLHEVPTTPSDRQSGSVVLGEKILIQTFELDCPAGADSDPMLNHEVRQVLAIEQDDTLG